MTLMILSATALPRLPPNTVKSSANTKTVRPSTVPVTGYDRVARRAFFLDSESASLVANKHVGFLEAVLIEEKSDTLSSGQLAQLVLAVDGPLAPRVLRVVSQLTKLFDTLFGAHDEIPTFRSNYLDLGGRGMATPYALVSCERTTSTQDDARRLIGRYPVLVVAEQQSSGRGRSGADWENAPSALAASLAFRPAWPPELWPRLTLVAGIAATRVLGDELRLKWPNDVMRGEAKIGGILTEVSGGVAVVGWGANLFWPDAPEGVGAMFDSHPRSDIAIEIAQAWTEQLLAMAEGSADEWPLDEYRSKCQTIGREITWKPGGRGIVTGVDKTGGLVVSTNEETVTLSAGSVQEVRSLPGESDAVDQQSGSDSGAPTGS